MSDTRTKLEIDVAGAQRAERRTSGLIAQYIHELSERHGQRRELRSATDESRARTRSLHPKTPQPCEGA